MQRIPLHRRWWEIIITAHCRRVRTWSGICSACYTAEKVELAPLRYLSNVITVLMPSIPADLGLWQQLKLFHNAELHSLKMSGHACEKKEQGFHCVRKKVTLLLTMRHGGDVLLFVLFFVYLFFTKNHKDPWKQFKILYIHIINVPENKITITRVNSIK